MWSLMKQLRMDSFVLDDRISTKFTLIVPSNAAWEKAQQSFSQAYNTLIDGQFPQYVSFVLHVIDKIEQLVLHYLFW